MVDSYAEGGEEGFDDLDGIVPDALVDDTYLCQIAKAQIVTSKHKFHEIGGRRIYVRWFILNWQILQPEEYSGWEHLTDMYRVASAEEYNNADPDERQAISTSRRKRTERLIQLGIPENELQTIAQNLDTLVGVQAYLTVQVRPGKDGKTNVFINNVTLASEVNEDSLMDVSNF